MGDETKARSGLIGQAGSVLTRDTTYHDMRKIALRSVVASLLDFQ